MTAFAPLTASLAGAPLTEFLPAAPGDETSAWGFALGWALAASKNGLIVCAMPETILGEWGLPHAEGLAQFGIDLSRLIAVRTQTQTDALWACEQALQTPGAVALCLIAAARKSLSLTATRRLLLFAEQNRSHCLLARYDPITTSAAWSRWRVSPTPSRGAERELGAPSFALHLDRNRAGPAGLSFHVQWSAHDRAFHEAALVGDLAAAAADRSAAARRRRAV